MAMVDSGTADVADIASAYISNELRLIEVGDLPGLIPTTEAARKKVAAGIFPDMKKALEDKYNVVLIGYTYAPFRTFYLRKKVDRLADLKGIKMRVTGAVDATLANALGASSVQMSHSEAYTALQQGVVDGMTGEDSTQANMKFYEVSKYITPIAYDGLAVFVVVNRQKFNAQPADIQKILIDSRAGIEDYTYSAMAEDMQVARQTLLKNGMVELTWPKEDMDQLQKTYEGTWTDWLSKAGSDAKALFEKVRGLVK